MEQQPALVHEYKEIQKEFGSLIVGLEQEDLIETYEDGNAIRLGLVGEFMATAQDPFYRDPRQMTKEEAKLRIALIQEELDELKEALESGDMVAQLDAYLDLQYVLDGSVLKSGMGYHFLNGFLEVHKNNMTKFPGGVALRNEAGKIIKPEGYKSIDLGEIYPELRD